jgi:hypothetical protein
MAPETMEIKTKSSDFIKIYFGFPMFEEYEDEGSKEKEER